MANTTRVHPNADPPSLRLRDLAFDQLKRPANSGDLDNTHFLIHAFQSSQSRKTQALQGCCETYFRGRRLKNRAMFGARTIPLR